MEGSISGARYRLFRENRRDANFELETIYIYNIPTTADVFTNTHVHVKYIYVSRTGFPFGTSDTA